MQIRCGLDSQTDWLTTKRKRLANTFSRRTKAYPHLLTHGWQDAMNTLNRFFGKVGLHSFILLRASLLLANESTVKRFSSTPFILFASFRSEFWLNSVLIQTCGRHLATGWVEFASFKFLSKSNCQKRGKGEQELCVLVGGWLEGCWVETVTKGPVKRCQNIRNDEKSTKASVGNVVRR